MCKSERQAYLQGIRSRYRRTGKKANGSGIYFMNLPTGFVRPAEDIDRLRGAAGRLLRQWADYERVLQQFGARPGR